MKKWVRCSEDNKRSDKHLIEISVYVACRSDIFSAKKQKNKSEQAQARTSILNSFQSFILNVFYALKRKHFIVEDNHTSNRENSDSWYMSFYPTDKDNNILPEHIILFRLSDHSLDDYEDRSRAYNQRIANEHKRMKDKKDQPFWIYNIVVSSEKGDLIFNSYPAAMKYVEQLLDELENQ